MKNSLTFSSMCQILKNVHCVLKGILEIKEATPQKNDFHTFHSRSMQDLGTVVNEVRAGNSELR